MSHRMRSLSTTSPMIPNAKLVRYQILSGIRAGQKFQIILVAIQACFKKVRWPCRRECVAFWNFLKLFDGAAGLAARAAILNNTSRLTNTPCTGIYTLTRLPCQNWATLNNFPPVWYQFRWDQPSIPRVTRVTTGGGSIWHKVGYSYPWKSCD